jgi:hypothetical protein
MFKPDRRGTVEMRENNSWVPLLWLHLPGIPSFSLVGMVASATNGCSALGDLEKLIRGWETLDDLE